MKSSTTKMLTGIMAIALLAMLSVTLSDSAQAQTTLKLRLCEDNTIYEEFTSNSNGSGEYFFAGTTVPGNKRRGLISFGALSEFIPPCAVIQSVSLRLHMSRTITGPKDVSMHRLLESWGESSSDAPGEEGYGAQAEFGDATWTKRYYPDDDWSRPGGTYENTASATTTVDQIGYYTWSSPGLAQDVEYFLRSGNSFGWILIGDESTGTTAKRFDTRENIDTSFHPMLTVVYTNPLRHLSVGFLIEGLTNGTTTITDNAKIFLHGASSPYPKIDSIEAAFDEYGNMTACFANAPAGNYYVVVRHRNSIETWSAAPVDMTSNIYNYYEFLTSASQAYGNNLTFVYPSFAIYSGDVNQDGTIDATDLQMIDNDAAGFVSGYVVTDLNGDEFVDGSDYVIADNNATNFISVIRP